MVRLRVNCIPIEPGELGGVNRNDTNQVYEGEWLADKPHGHGVHLFLEQAATSKPKASQCNRYVGQFSDGLRNGIGTFTFSNGARYHGEWRNNKKHGRGVYTFPDGRIYDGPFEHDHMVRPMFLLFIESDLSYCCRWE